MAFDILQYYFQPIYKKLVHDIDNIDWHNNTTGVEVTRANECKITIDNKVIHANLAKGCLEKYCIEEIAKYEKDLKNTTKDREVVFEEHVNALQAKLDKYDPEFAELRKKAIDKCKQYCTDDELNNIIKSIINGTELYNVCIYNNGTHEINKRSILTSYVFGLIKTTKNSYYIQDTNNIIKSNYISHITDATIFNNTLNIFDMFYHSLLHKSKHYTNHYDNLNFTYIDLVIIPEYFHGTYISFNEKLFEQLCIDSIKYIKPKFRYIYYLVDDREPILYQFNNINYEVCKTRLTYYDRIQLGLQKVK